MDKTEVIAQLVERMESSEQEAEVWLEAVMDVLHGSFASGASMDGGVKPNNRLIQGKTPSKENVPVLRSVTRMARLSVGDEVLLDRFPFRVGREGRLQPIARRLGRREQRRPAEETSNELYLRDFGKFVNVSREHFQIEVKSDGTYELVDRGSACGTIVGSQVVGGNCSGGRCPLQFGDAIVVGTRRSGLIFEFSHA